MLPEVFGRSLLIHLQWQSGKKPVEAECLFYGQTEDFRQQVAVIRTCNSKGESLNLYSGACDADGRRGVVGTGTGVMGEPRPDVTLKNADGFEATISPAGDVTVMLGNSALKPVAETWQILFYTKEAGTLDA